MVAVRLPPADRRIRVIGFDDAPHDRAATEVQLAGVVCANARFEGMVWGRAAKDGWDATAVLAKLLIASKYHAQVHAVLVDGIAVGGFNVVDLQELAATTGRPCLAVMRRPPRLEAVRAAIERLPEPDRRLGLLGRAGPVYERPPFVFQVAGADEATAHQILVRCTDTGHVPEALRLAHLIGSAVVDGQSRGRA